MKTFEYIFIEFSRANAVSLHTFIRSGFLCLAYYFHSIRLISFRKTVVTNITKHIRKEKNEFERIFSANGLNKNTKSERELRKFDENSTAGIFLMNQPTNQSNFFAAIMHYTTFFHSHALLLFSLAKCLNIVESIKLREKKYRKWMRKENDNAKCLLWKLHNPRNSN